MNRPDHDRSPAPRARPARHGRTRRRRDGFTFVETLIAASVVLGGLLVISSGMVRAKMARLDAEQQVVAAATLDQAAANLRANSLASALTNYAPNGAGQPFPAKGSGPGPAIFAPGLSDAADPTKQAQVTVRLFTDETAVEPEVGLPRDLDGSGTVDDTDTTRLGADGQPLARVLPFSLTITFRGPGGGSSTATRRGVLTRVR